MTSYLAAVAARELDASANGLRTVNADDGSSSISKREPLRGIAPRLASVHEPWAILPLDESTEVLRPRHRDTNETPEMLNRDPMSAIDKTPHPTAHNSEPKERGAQRPRVEEGTHSQPIEPVNTERVRVALPDRIARRGDTLAAASDAASGLEPGTSSTTVISQVRDQSNRPALPDQRLTSDADRRSERRDRGESALPATIVFPRVRDNAIVAPTRGDTRDNGTPAREIAADSTAEPTVIVTIGRIEMRAVSTQPTPRPPRIETRSMMSLEDYLEQRVKGVR
ncbi:MAG: hypothetical protein ABI556_05945 [Gemmatimonadales bacterium]